MKSFKEFSEALNYIPAQVAQSNAARNNTTTAAPVLQTPQDDRTQSQIRRNLAIISKKTGTDYTPLMIGLKNNQHAMGLLNQLLQDLMQMGTGTGSTLANRMV